jgi:signal transduction histidine kinase
LKKKRPSAKARGPRLARPSANLLASALGTLGEGVLIADRRWTRNGLRIRFANQSLCAMTRRGARDLNGRPHGDLHADHEHFLDLRKWLKHLTPGLALSGEGYLACGPGQRLYTTWIFSPVTDARGRVTHISITYRDMTAKRRLQEDLIHAQRLDAVGRLAGGVAHDFNNLLSVINGYCEILRSKPSVIHHAAREIGEIHRAGLHAAGLVRQLLAFSRRQALDPKIVSLNQLVQENADILAKLLQPDKALVLSLQADSDHVRVDPVQIQQVLLNLTINARDALEPGGRVTIHTDFREIKPGRNRRATDMPPGRYVLLSISDNGSGMNAEVQAHLFEPFFTTKEQGKGTGLGLSLVYGIVQQSGGYIFVQSTPGTGSVFEIYLPSVQQPVTTHTVVPPAIPSTRGHETVVLIEEDPVVCKMVAGILTSDGYRVLATDTVAKARLLIRRHRKSIDLLIIDSARTGAPGEKIIRELHAAHPRLCLLHTSSVEITALPDFPTQAQGALTKPYALSTLLRAARSLLDGKGATPTASPFSARPS